MAPHRGVQGEGEKERKEKRAKQFGLNLLKNRLKERENQFNSKRENMKAALLATACLRVKILVISSLSIARLNDVI